MAKDKPTNEELPEDDDVQSVIEEEDETPGDDSSAEVSPEEGDDDEVEAEGDDSPADWIDDEVEALASSYGIRPEQLVGLTRDEFDKQLDRLDQIALQRRQAEPDKEVPAGDDPKPEDSETVKALIEDGYDEDSPLVKTMRAFDERQRQLEQALARSEQHREQSRWIDLTNRFQELAIQSDPERYGTASSPNVDAISKALDTANRIAESRGYKVEDVEANLSLLVKRADRAAFVEANAKRESKEAANRRKPRQAPSSRKKRSADDVVPTAGKSLSKDPAFMDKIAQMVSGS